MMIFILFVKTLSGYSCTRILWVLVRFRVQFEKKQTRIKDNQKSTWSKDKYNLKRSSRATSNLYEIYTIIHSNKTHGKFYIKTTFPILAHCEKKIQEVFFLFFFYTVFQEIGSKAYTRPANFKLLLLRILIESKGESLTLPVIEQN